MPFRLLTSEDEEYERIWESIKPIDKALLIWVANYRAGLYRPDAKAFIGLWLGLSDDDVETHTIQNALQRLRGEYLAPIEQGVWAFEDIGFKQWIAQSFAPT